MVFSASKTAHNVVLYDHSHFEHFKAYKTNILYGVCHLCSKNETQDQTVLLSLQGNKKYHNMPPPRQKGINNVNSPTGARTLDISVAMPLGLLKAERSTN